MNDINIKKEIRTSIQQGTLTRLTELIGSAPEHLQIETAFGTWLHVAAAAGQLEIVKYLVSMGMDINRRSGIFNAAPIKEAASEGHIEVVRYLLTKGASLDTSEPERNPLFAAIYGGHFAIAKLLVESGIDAHVRYSGSSMTNMDAADFAKERGQREIATFLESLNQSKSMRPDSIEN